MTACARTPRGWVVAMVLAVLAWLVPPAAGHELMPAYLEIRQTGPETYALVWKVPDRNGTRIPLEVVLPEGCEAIGKTTRSQVGDVWYDRWQVRIEGGLVGQTLGIAGLAGTNVETLVRVVRLDGSTQLTSLKPFRTTFVVEPPRGWAEVVGGYISLGIEHILGGVDHLLFVVGLLFVVRGSWTLAKTITAFTVAHSLTLAATTLGWIYPSGPTINVLIALSIVFLGPEMVRVARGETSLTIRRPWVVAFAFGLLHGFGFASGLSAIGLPRGELLAGLISFNVGVEIGQLGFVVVLLAVAWATRVLEFRWSAWQKLVPGYVVGSLGASWTIGRLIVLLGIGSLV